MSREAFDVREPYTGTGLVDTYTFDFKIESADQLLIKEYDENGVETQSLRGDDIGAYLQSITFDEVEGGGSIVLVDPLTDDYTLVLLLANDEPLQEYTFKNKSDFTLDRIEAALDYIVGALQRAAYLVERSVTLPDLLTTASFDPTLPTDIVSGEAGRILAVNDAKTGWEFGPTTDSIFAAETAAGISEDNAAASAAAALASATAADVSEASALVAETNAELAQAGAETAEDNAAASAAAAAASALAAAASPAGEQAIADTNQEISVVFGSSYDFGGTTYGLAYSLRNTVDADDDLQFLHMMTVAKSGTGFTVRFSAPISGSNYVLDYRTGAPV